MVDFPSKDQYGLDDFRRLVEVLRGEGGCPWDREQTHASLRRAMLEEAYEVCGAIDEGDALHLREELGDVLLQVVFHASLAAEEGSFDLDDVADAECRKLIYRHPHVFGDVTVSGSDEVLANWDVLKRAEKEQRTVSEAMAGVTDALPALWRAEKCRKKAASGGAETPRALDELSAETEALRLSLERGGADAFRRVGELLYAAVGAARLAGVDPEAALHAACERDIARVRAREESPAST